MVGWRQHVLVLMLWNILEALFDRYLSYMFYQSFLSAHRVFPACPFPGAASNFSFHVSSCLNMVTHSAALGWPYSGSAPPSSNSFYSNTVNILSLRTSAFASMQSVWVLIGAYVNDCVFLLKNSACKRTLTSIVQAIRVSAMLDKNLD